jgi:hypothetical protein
MFWPISFTLVNSLNEGDFYKGIAPMKVVDDDITHDWSDRRESCLREAVYYLEHGTVSTKGLYIGEPVRKLVRFNEKSERNDNAYFIESGNK